MKKKEYKTDPNYHTYEYVVVATTKLVDKNNKVIRRHRQIIDRCKDEKSAEKSIFFSKKMQIDKIIAYESGEPITKKTIVDRPRISYINNEGQFLTENVKYDVLKKSDYFQTREEIYND